MPLRLRDTHAHARAVELLPAIAVSARATYELREYSYIIYMMKNGNMNKLFLAKNKNEDSDLGWTVHLKINLDKL